MKILILIAVILSVTTTAKINSDHRKEMIQLDKNLAHADYQLEVALDNQAEVEEHLRLEAEAKIEAEKLRQSDIDAIRHALKGRPLAPYAETIYEASEAHLGGDWKMLVAIHVSEQGSGVASNINAFGYSKNNYSNIGTRENEIWAIAKMLSSGGYAGLTTEQKLCRWNTGRATNDCQYTGLRLYQSI